MNTYRSPWFAAMAALTAGGLLAACVPYMAPPSIAFPVKEQEVPVIVAIGPFDTSKIALEGAPLGEDISSAIQGQLKDALGRTQVFKDVVILKLPAGAKNLDAEQILSTARAEHADLLLVGEVKEFSAELPVFLFGSQYDVTMKLHAKLYNVANGAQIWKKTEKVDVRKDGSGIKRVESLDAIVRYVAVPPITAGILPSLVEYVQTEYVASLHPVKGGIATESSEVFGAAELAKIDAEMAPPPTRVKPKAHAYAVVIGVEDYRDLPRVDYAKRDAELMKKYLVQSLGYRENNIVLLLNDRVTRSQMEARLEKWLPKQVGDNKDAEVFVYYGGHGAPDPGSNQAFLVPYDGDPSYLETTAYPLKRLYDTLSKLPSHNVTVVMDSCFSGAGGRSVIAKGARPMLIQVENPLMATENMVVISAAAGNQISSAYPEKRHGLFTYYFLKGLQGEADADKNGVVDVEEIYGYVKPHVEADARRMNAEQSPQLLPGADLLGTRAKAHLIELKR